MTIVEAKGLCYTGADTVTVTRNEILTGLNKPDQYILTLVEVEDGQSHPPCYARQPFTREPDFGVTSVNYDWKRLWEAGIEPGREGAQVRRPLSERGTR